MELIEKIKTWAKANMLLAVIILVIGAGLLFRRQVKKLLGTTRRIKRRKPMAAISRPRAGTRSGRAIPRSVGTSRGKGYPGAGGGTIPFKYNKDGTVKKAWQVPGTLAAKRRMAGLRKQRA